MEEKKQQENNKPIELNANKSGIYFIVGAIILFVLGLAAFFLVGGDNLSSRPIVLFMILGVAALVVIISIVFLVLIAKGKIDRKEPDYRAFFIIGISWIPLGLVLKNPGFWAMGLIFMTLGLANKDKWKDQPKWKELPEAQRNLKMVIIGILTLLLFFGLFMFLSAR